jgi:rfaE bifunctional protein kinase chain/domain
MLPFPLTRNALEELLRAIRSVRIAIVGDFCLDGYWFLKTADDEHSVETGLPTRRVNHARYSPGAAGNVAVNLRALSVRSAHAFGVIGDDPFGPWLVKLLQNDGVDIGGLIVQERNWSTHVYGKPYDSDKEENRIDFGSSNSLDDETARALFHGIKRILDQVEVVVINQQVRGGIHESDFFRSLLTELVQTHPAVQFILDSRDRSDQYPAAARKLNEHEAARLCGFTHRWKEPVPRNEILRAAGDLHRRWSRPVFITRGAIGCIVADEQGTSEIPVVETGERVDPVGAGDSMLAGIAAALGAGRDARTAAALGNLAAAVTVRKLLQTGTASPAEILNIAFGGYHP